MARPKRNTTIVLEDALSPDKELTAILGTLSPGGKYTIKIYRMVGSAQKWLTNRTPDEMKDPEKVLSEDFGMGKYLIRVYDETAGKWMGSKIFDIDEEAENVRAPLMSPYMMPPANNGPNFTDVIGILQTSSDRQMATMQAIMSAMTAMVTAAMSNRQSLDPIALATLLKGGGASEQIGLMKEMMGLAKEFSGEGGGKDEDVVTTVFKSVLPALLQRSPALPQLQAGNPPATAINPPTLQASSIDSPAPAVPSSLPAPALSKEEKEEMDVIEFIKTLKRKAMEDQDPEFWAEYIELNAADPGPARILSAIKIASFDQIYKGLIPLDADLAGEKIQDWFKRLHFALTNPAPADEGE